MENNAAERPVKNPAIGRTNYLFVGGIGDGHHAAIFYSLVSSAKANGVESFSWLERLHCNCAGSQLAVRFPSVPN